MKKNQRALALFKSIAFIGCYFLVGAVFAQLKPLFPPQFERYAQGIVGTAAAIVAVLIFLRIERKSWKDFGLIWEKATIPRFLKGLVLGMLLATVLLLVQILYSDLEVALVSDVNVLSFFGWSLAFIPLAFMEEVAFRSYPLIELNRAFGFRVTQVILAVLFAMYHMAMMWSPQSAMLGPGIWALMFALTAISSNGIAVPTGLHFGLNFIQSVLGGQEGIDPMWTIAYAENTSDAAIAANEQFGVALQFTVLLVAIIATEVYIRRTKYTTDNLYYR